MNSDRRILLVSHAFAPTLRAGTFRVLRFNKHLSEGGWTCHILSSKDDEYGSYMLDSTLCDQIPAGTSVDRTTTWRPYEFFVRRVRKILNPRRSTGTTVKSSAGRSGPAEAPSTWKKKTHQLRDLLFHTPDAEIGWLLPALVRGLRIVRRHAPQAIVVSSPPHSSNLIGVGLKILTGIPLVLDLRDPWSRAPWTAAEQSASLRRVMELVESICVHRADHVVLNTDALCEEFRTHYRQLSPTRFSTIPNGYDPDMIPVVRQLEATHMRTHANASRERPWLLVHAGALYGQRDPSQLLHAIRALQDRGTRVAFEQVGDIDPRLNFLQLAEDLGIASLVTVSPMLAHRATLERLAGADAILILQPETQVQIPSKLFEAALFDKPLLALTGRGTTYDIFTKYRLGTVADHGSAAEIEQALQTLIARWPELQAQSQRQEMLRDFDGRQLSHRLEEVLQIVCSCRSAGVCRPPDLEPAPRDSSCVES